VGLIQPSKGLGEGRLMADVAKNENNLTALHITLQRKGSEEYVLLAIQQAGETLREWSLEADEVGVPRGLGESGGADAKSTFNLPGLVLAAVKKEVSRRLQGHALWLHLDEVDVGLPLVPWEQLLQPLGFPLLRMPYYEVPPIRLPGTIDIAFCVSAASRRQGTAIAKSLETMARQILADPPRKTLVHVFCDSLLHGRVSKRLAPLADENSDSRVIVYDPREAKRLATSPGDDQLPYASSPSQEPPSPISETSSWESAEGPRNVLTSPWLEWMHRKLLDIPVDTVVFLSPGQIAWEEASLVLTESPVVDRDGGHQWMVSLNAADISAFLTLTGATGAVFVSPSTNHSVGSLRLLQHQVALARSGSSLFYDYPLDPDATVLKDVLRILHDEPRGPPPISPAFSLYCHPSLVGHRISERAETIGSESLSDYTLVDTAVALLSMEKDTVPAWLATAQRSLEQSAAQLIRRRDLFSEDAGSGIEAGLRLVTEIISGYQSQSGQSPSLSADPTSETDMPSAEAEGPELTAS
jgi:hypothetical protein